MMLMRELPLSSTFSVNNLAVLWTAKAFMPDMVEKNHGHFLIIASQTGYFTTLGLTDYSASKAASIAIYEGLHAEVRNIYKALSVRVSCVSPNTVNTLMFRGIKLSPLMPALHPEDVGNVVADILYGGRACHTLVPKSGALLAITRALPDWIRVAIQAAVTDMLTDLKPHDPMEDC